MTLVGQGLLLSTEGLTEAVSNGGKAIACSNNELSHVINREVNTRNGQVLIPEYRTIAVLHSTLRCCCICHQLHFF